MALGKREKRLCVILGGGGHAQVLLDCIQASGMAKPLAILDTDQSRWGQTLLGVSIMGGDDLLPELKQRGVKYFVVGLGSTGDNAPRKRLFELGLGNDLYPMTVVHPSAFCSTWAKVAGGAQLLPGSIVNAGATLGANVIVNSGAIVEHDCCVSDHSHVGPGARLGANVHVKEKAHIGLGACVRQGLCIGQNSIVGVGAVVVNDVPDDVVVVGVPARILRRVGRS
jgi:sugar O-acyltransferase (sialic acid O-acetyltransferase NeuD family)